MKIKYLAILLIIIVLCSECYSQRGGGRSRSRSSSSRSRSYSSYGRRSSSRGNGGGLLGLIAFLFGFGGNSTNKTDGMNITAGVDGTKTKGLNLQTMLGWGVAIVFILICVAATLFKKRNRNKEIRRITDHFVRVNESMCNLTENQRNDLIDWFMQSSWKIQLKTGLSNYISSWAFKMKNLTKRTDYVYEIEAEGSEDNIGDSTVKGILLFNDNGLNICFDKLYNNKSAAGQTGKWDILIYKGYQEGKIFNGEWYFGEFRGDNQYSGTMRMFTR